MIDAANIFKKTNIIIMLIVNLLITSCKSIIITCLTYHLYLLLINVLFKSIINELENNIKKRGSHY